MKGSELRNFLFDLQSRFRDFRLNNAHYSLIGRIELDDSQRDLSFAELLALFEIIAGRTPTSTANSRQESLSNEKEDMYLDRISQLENSLDDKKREYQDLHQSYHQIQNELATVLAELKKQKQMVCFHCLIFLIHLLEISADYTIQGCERCSFFGTSIQCTASSYHGSVTASRYTSFV